jgi:tRNA (guanosine-2'-O-)-methyltransferase
MEQAEVKKQIKHLSEFLHEKRCERIREIARQRTRHFSIIVENLYQTHNISAILRTAECLGIQDVHVIENNFQYEISRQVTLGAHKWLSIHRYREWEDNTVQCIKNIKKQGYKVIATLPHQSDCMLDDTPIDEKTAFIFGTEQEGLTQKAIVMADGFLKIPMYGFTESYNVSISVALTMMNVVERLRKSEIDWRLPKEEQLELELLWMKKSVKDADQIIERYNNDALLNDAL